MQITSGHAALNEVGYRGAVSPERTWTWRERLVPRQSIARLDAWTPAKGAPGPMNPWMMLAIAIVAELVGTTALKLSVGFTRIPWAALVVAGYAVSFYLMAQTLKTLPIGVVYAIWAGVGTVGTAVIGLAIFGESLTALKALGIALIVGGVIALNTGGTH
jgi:small multidrug resistance pump